MGKKGKGGRGAGKKVFIQNVEEMTIRDRQFEEERDARIKRRAGSDDEDEEEGKATENANEATEEIQFEKSVDQEPEKLSNQKEIKPQASVANNQNIVKKAEKTPKVQKEAPKQTEIVDYDVGLTRKQRDALEEIRKREEYMRRHLAGETEEARADLARLALVRKRREETAKKRIEEGRPAGMSKTGLPSDSEADDSSSDDDEEEGGASNKPTKIKSSTSSTAVVTPVMSELQAKKKAAATADVEKVSADGPIRLKAMDVKKMSGDALKDALRERGLDVQGQKKDLMKRLVDFEAARS